VLGLCSGAIAQHKGPCFVEGIGSPEAFITLFILSDKNRKDLLN
jgi:hypothetical protein